MGLNKKILSLLLGVFVCLGVASNSYAVTLTAAQMQVAASLSDKQKTELAAKAGVALPSLEKKAVSAPVSIKARGAGSSNLELKMNTESTVSEGEKLTRSESAAMALPVQKVKNKTEADKLEVHRAFASFSESGKPMTVNTALKQFGYSLFAGSPDSFTPPVDVPVPAEYVLGPGDEVNIHLYGGEDRDLTLTVDRRGEMNFPSIGPLAVAGMNFSELKAFIVEQVKEKMLGVTANVSMGKLRSIRIFALGDVERPGSYTVSGLSTIANALYVSGGINKTGSLRNIQLKRNGKIVAVIDLYDYLLKGDTSGDVRLLPGDVVFVPPLGRTAGISGQVIRPAIYELKSERSVHDLIQLSGGLLPTAYKKMALIERIAVGGGRSVVKLSLSQAKPVSMLKDGDLLKVFAVSDYQNNPVYLLGHVKRPGKYAWNKHLTLIDILPSMTDLLPDAKLDYAVVERETGVNKELSILHFNPQDILNKKRVLKLQPRDKVYIFAGAQLREMPVVRISGSVQKPGSYELKKNMQLLDLIMAAGGVNKDADLRKVEFIRVQKGTRKPVSYTYAFSGKNKPVAGDISIHFDEVSGLQNISNAQNPLLQDEDRVVIHSIYEQQPKQMVQVVGQVNHPGVIELPHNMRVTDLIFAGGNLTEKAFIGNAELTRYMIEDGAKRVIKHFSIDLKAAFSGDESANILLQNHDVLMVRSISNWRAYEQIELKGEFKFPGIYTIEDGETLAQVIKRAGGVTDKAFMSAAMFMRASIRKQQEQQLNQSLDRLEKELAQTEALNQSINDPKILLNKQKGLTAAQAAMDKMRKLKPQGRLLIDMDKYAKLKGGAELKLVDGDVLFMPKKPDQILIMGEVYNQSAMLYRKNMDRDDYIDLAGGITKIADEDSIYIVRANGYIDSGRGWNKNKHIYPGDTIVVPQNLEAFNLLDSTLDWSKVLMQIGIFTASMVTVGIL